MPVPLWQLSQHFIKLKKLYAQWWEWFFTALLHPIMHELLYVTPLVAQTGLRCRGQQQGHPLLRSGCGDTRGKRKKAKVNEIKMSFIAGRLFQHCFLCLLNRRNMDTNAEARYLWVTSYHTIYASSHKLLGVHHRIEKYLFYEKSC